MTIQGFRICLGNRADYRSFLLLTITNYYNLSQCIVIGQGDLKLSFLTYFNSLRIHTDVGNDKG